MTTESKPTLYRYLISGVLEQKTALSTGGNRFQVATEHDDVDMALAKDGAGRYTLRGTTLAGALIATARLLYQELPKTITEEIAEDEIDRTPNRLQESHWIFHHAHPAEVQHLPEMRDLVAMRQKTGAAMHGAKYSVETLPCGTNWDFLMEVDAWQDSPGNLSSPIAVALTSLKQWETMCWLGRDIARGLGWLSLKDIKVFELTSQQAVLWPNAREKPLVTLARLEGDGIIQPMPSEKIVALREACKPEVDECYHSGKIRIKTGEAGGGWGLDTVSVIAGKTSKDKELKAVQPEYEHASHWIYPLGQKKKAYESTTVNSRIATLYDGTPYIPGSGLRGPLRHALSWLLRKQGATIWEPGTPYGEGKEPSCEDGMAHPGKDDRQDVVLQLFGSTEESGLLLISDANLTCGDWHLLYQEMHAEDEFTQGAFDQAKFDRPVLLNAEFEADYCLIRTRELRDSKRFNILIEALDALNALGRHRLIAIGGGKWKGLGWVNVELTNCEKEGSHA